jgi:DNA polymerase III epsilon subunit-like protein
MKNDDDIFDDEEDDPYGFPGVTITAGTLDGLNKLLSIPKDKVMAIDTETTGIDPKKDEVLSLSIVDGNGSVVFDSLIKPDHRKRWPNATKINGITWKDVKDKPTLLDYKDELSKLASKCELVVGYNIKFDLAMLYEGGISDFPSIKNFDVMEEYAPVRGSWDDYHQDYRWCKLSTCAGHYHIKFDPHKSSEDARATMECFYALLADEKYIDPLKVASEKEKASEEKQRENQNYKNNEEQSTKPSQIKDTIRLIFKLSAFALGFMALISLPSGNGTSTSIYMVFCLIFAVLAHALNTRKSSKK